MDDVQSLKKLIDAGHACISILTHEEQYALEVIRHTAMNLDRKLWIWSAADGVREGLLKDCDPIPKTEPAVIGLAGMAETEPNSICVLLDVIVHLQKDARAMRRFREIVHDHESTGRTLILVDSAPNVPDIVRSYATPFELSYPDEEELNKIVRRTLRKIAQTMPIEVKITKKGMDTIVRNLRGLTRRQAERVVADTVADDSLFSDADIHVVVSSKRRMIQRGGLLEFIKTPQTLDEIGGMRKLKTWLTHRKGAFKSEAQEFGLNAPKGVLMLGVQGAGKSLCAKAIATAWGQPLLKLDPGSLYGSYIGESERNLRQALSQVESMAPVILWIDEIEKAFASAASKSSDGGLSQRMFGTLLTWLQEHEEPVFVVATANDIEALPPELLRKGRFDEIFFVDLPRAPIRKQIFAIHLDKRKRDPADFDLEALAEAADGYSGAEIEQAVLSALHKAFARRKDVDTELILDCVRESQPLSVTMAERVQNLREWGAERCVPAD